MDPRVLEDGGGASLPLVGGGGCVIGAAAAGGSIGDDDLGPPNAIWTVSEGSLPKAGNGRSRGFNDASK